MFFLLFLNVFLNVFFDGTFFWKATGASANCPELFSALVDCGNAAPTKLEGLATYHSSSLGWSGGSLA